MKPILPFPKDLTATVTSRVKPPKNIESLKNPAIFTVPGLASAIAESTRYTEPQSNAAKFFKGPTLQSNAAAVFAKPPPNNPNRPPTNTELAQIRAEAEAREAAKAAELQQQKQARNRLDRLRKLQRNLPSQTSLIGKMRAPSPNTTTKYINETSGRTGGKRKTLRKQKNKKTNKRRH